MLVDGIEDLKKNQEKLTDDLKKSEEKIIQKITSTQMLNAMGKNLLLSVERKKHQIALKQAQSV